VVSIGVLIGTDYVTVVISRGNAWERRSHC